MNFTVPEQSLEWALSHVALFGDTDIFPLLPEFDAVRADWPNVKTALAEIDLEKRAPGPKSPYAVPKPDQGFRICTRLDIVDVLLFSGVAHHLADDVEIARAPEDVVYSSRFSPKANGSLYKSSPGWKEFSERAEQMASDAKCTHVLVADISDFYNQISLHRIENNLEQCGVDPDKALAIERYLTSLSDRESRGIAVGPNASKLFSEVALIDLDSMLASQGFKFVRFVDDLRLFFGTYTDALQGHEKLASYLHARHRLALNAKKTRILKKSTFLQLESENPERLEQWAQQEAREEYIGQLLEEISEAIEGSYGEVTYEADLDSIPEEDWDKIEFKSASDALVKLMDLAVERDEVSLNLAKYALRKALSMRTTKLLGRVTANLQILTPVLREIVLYLRALQHKLRAGQLEEIRTFIRKGPSSHLRFVRLWLAELLLHVPQILPTDQALTLIDSWKDRELDRYRYLFARRDSSRSVVLEKRDTWQAESPSTRRAILLACSILRPTERNMWLKPVTQSDDIVESAIARFSLSKP